MVRLSQRRLATSARQSTDRVRVCLAAPPPTSATLLVLSSRASRNGRPVEGTRRIHSQSSQLGKLGSSEGDYVTDLPRRRVGTPGAPLASPRCSPWLPARSGTVVARSPGLSGDSRRAPLTPEPRSTVSADGVDDAREAVPLHSGQPVRVAPTGHGDDGRGGERRLGPCSVGRKRSGQPAFDGQRDEVGVCGRLGPTRGIRDSLPAGGVGETAAGHHAAARPGEPEYERIASGQLAPQLRDSPRVQLGPGAAERLQVEGLRITISSHPAVASSPGRPRMF